MKLSIWFHVHSVPFTRDVVLGESSLGGSESACKGVAEALAARGHDVKIFVRNIAPDACIEHRKVFWRDADELSDLMMFAAPDVFIALRDPSPFQMAVPAELNVLWCQDLLIDKFDGPVLAQLPQVDQLWYVSEYQRAQWEAQHPYLGPLGQVTRNGIDLALAKDASDFALNNRLIYISRPERGLEPILDMWPALKARWPEVEIGICRYESMYDGEGTQVAEMCATSDRRVAEVNAQHGGIINLGRLAKTDLYREIASSFAMLYPGVEGFAETNCIAATEAQACGTPFIGAWKGALPETLHPDAGILIDGDPMDDTVQAQYIDALCVLRDDTARYVAMQESGRQWVNPRASYDTIAAEWEQHIEISFEKRVDRNPIGVLRQLLHWDRHAEAKIHATRMLRQYDLDDEEGHGDDPDYNEYSDAIGLCDRVIAQVEQTAEDYAKNSIDTIGEAKGSGRLQQVAVDIAATGAKTVLDVACGNGSMAFCLAKANPNLSITAYDYSEGVLDKARSAVEQTPINATFHQAGYTEIPIPAGDTQYDAVFCGEFLEHVEKPWELLDRLEQYCAKDGWIYLTTPCGPFGELLQPWMTRQRGHVHAFSLRDISTMFGEKRNFVWRYAHSNMSYRGSACGFWILQYQPGGGAGQPLDYDHTILTTRPYQRLVAAMITKNEEDWISGCLKSLYGVVDDVVLVDTGSTDKTIEIAEASGAHVYPAEWPESFAKARNLSLEMAESHAADWILWIDADERLAHGNNIPRYITGAGPYISYAIDQQHLSQDVPVFADMPNRLFKMGEGIEFYGYVHEQPEQAPDAGIIPSLALNGEFAPKVVHFGYQDEPTRMNKLMGRNLQLLTAELESGHPRELAYVLQLRDLVNLAIRDQKKHGGRLTHNAGILFGKAAELFRLRFADPTCKYHDTAWPFFQSAMQQLGTGVECKWAFTAARDHITGRPRIETSVFGDEQELEQMVTAKVAKWSRSLAVTPVNTTPVATRDDGQWAAPAPQTEPEDMKAYA